MSSAEATNISLASAQGIRDQRRRALIVFTTALILLIVALALSAWAHIRNNEARSELSQAEGLVASARQRQAVANKQRLLQEASKALAQRAETLGLGMNQWSERKINLQQQTVPRDAANDILVGTGRGNGRLFLTESFDLSVTRPDENLFVAPTEVNQPLRLTLRGTALFGTKGNY
jgi:hypothetical protein